MKSTKNFARLLALLTVAVATVGTGCQSSHTHDFSYKVQEDKFLKSEASCSSARLYYYSCECGEKGEKAFPVGAKLTHDYAAEIESEEYLRKSANCQKGAEYYKSCSMCGQKSVKTFYADGLGDHSYTEEAVNAKYLKEEATSTASAVYYKSCVCGLIGEDTFVYGEPLREYTEEEKVNYKPASLTVTLYDTETSTYGFTYNTTNTPLRPVLQIAEGENFAEYKEYDATVTQETSYTTTNTSFTYYVVKAEVQLAPLKSYTYRAYDKYVDVGTELATLETKDLTSSSFTFAHTSDSQCSETGAPGTYFGNVLAQVEKNCDFIVHTGDVVEWSKYESEWKNMLDTNFQYLSKIPVMAISGNHETTYQNGANETFKHFNNKIPEQETELGYYYSFNYGNAKFIMLNTNRLTGNQLTDDQYNWLVDELENNTATWTIVSLHNPVYSAGRYGSDPSRNSISLALRSQLKGIFAQYGVDIVLQGHDHVVSRTHPMDENGNPVQETWETVDGVQYSVDPSGVIYVMNGPAGTQTRAPDENRNDADYKYANQSYACSWAEFAIDGNTLTVSVKFATNNGQAIAYPGLAWGIKKTK